MKVKIVKANRPMYWYAAEIGKLFDVVEDGKYYVVNDGSGRYIDWMDAVEVKTVSCKIDLSWVKGLAREVISEVIQKKLFECGAAWNILGAELEKDVCCYLFVVNNIITTTGEKKKFDGLQDGNWCTKEQFAQIPEVSVNNALAGKFWTYSSVPKKEEAPKPLYYKVNLFYYKGKERELISKAIQEEAFKKGFRWGMYGETYRHTDMPRLVFWTQDNTICYGSTPDDPWMNDKEDKILTVEEILSGALPNVKK